MIFQDPLAALNPVYPVSWQIAETFRIRGVDARESRERALHLLDRVGILNAAQRANDYPHQFSGGQRQRIMIAMALALKPVLLIADEPTSSLDVTVQARILNLLKDIQAEAGQGILLITHDLGVVAQVADRVAIMKEGVIVETGPVRDIFNRPNHPYTQRLLTSVPGRDGFLSQREIRKDDAVLEARDVKKIYELPAFFGGKDKSVKALDGISFDLRRGETLGIVGESGSGKSTLARLLLCLERPSAGTIICQNRDVGTFSVGTFSDKDLYLFRRKMQVVFQDPTASLNPYMTVRQIISEPWAIHPDVVPRSMWRDRVNELLVQVGLQPDHSERYPHQFSGGQRQRIAIARALALKPEIIVCDEALSALDVSIQAQILDLFKALRDEYHFSCIFIGHDLRVVRDFCDRVVVMFRGRIVEEGTSERVFDHPEHAYTRELIASSPLPDPDVARATLAQLGTRRSVPFAQRTTAPHQSS
jgi:peptide/nickel transport system ATP-binding protein